MVKPGTAAGPIPIPLYVVHIVN